MKTLHFDARFIRLDHHDGISRFSVELIQSLAKKIDVVAIIYDLRQLDYLPKGIKYLVLNRPESLQELWIARKLNKAGVESVFSPMQVMGSFGRKYKLVLTLHDLIYYRHRKPPQDLSLLLRLIWRLYHLSYIPQRLLLNRADAVVTVSKTTQELIKRNRLTKRPVTVVYNASSLERSTKPRKYPENRDLIYIGSFMPYKNVETLICGVGLTEGFTLHLLSKIDPAREEQLTRLANASDAKVVFHRGVTDGQYLELLRSAFALVSASKDEGFGIPLIEAMSQGTPVIVSDLEIFREVSKNSGHFFSAGSAESFASKVESLANAKLWQSASKSSLEQSKHFNWEESADALIEAFNQLAT